MNGGPGVDSRQPVCEDVLFLPLCTCILVFVQERQNDTYLKCDWVATLEIIRFLFLFFQLLLLNVWLLNLLIVVEKKGKKKIRKKIRKKKKL